MRLAARITALAALAALGVTHSPAAHASGGVLAPSATADAETLDVQIAVTKSAGSPALATRWSRITVEGVPSVMWLVPVRPGATVDYSNDAWLDSLDDATAPRIAPPTNASTCEVRTEVERIPTWGGTATKRYPKSVTVLETEADARAHAAALDFRVSTALGARIRDAYARGWAFVAFEIASPTGGGMSSPTVRVRDDGGLLPGGAVGVVPLALTGTGTATSRVTAFVIGEGSADLPGARDLDASSLTWDLTGSSYVASRASLLGSAAGTSWVRESATNRAFWNEQLLPKGAIAPLYSSYFRGASGQTRATCETAALEASSAGGVVGRACGAGAVAKVPGGNACAPDAGAIDPAAFTCGTGVDDLALALSGSSPAKVVATRFAGIVSAGSYGSDLAVSSSSSLVPPIQSAGTIDCANTTPAAPPPSGGLSMPSNPGSSSSSTTAEESDGYYRATDSCGSGAVVVIADDSAPADESCSGSTTSTSSGGSYSGSSSSGSSGWDSDDDSDDSDDSDDGDDSDDSSDSSGWDDSDRTQRSHGMNKATNGAKGPMKAPGAKKTSGVKKAPGVKKSTGAKQTKATKKTNGRSPVSRYALLFVALILPLRRRLRNAARSL